MGKVINKISVKIMRNGALVLNVPFWYLDRFKTNMEFAEMFASVMKDEVKYELTDYEKDQVADRYWRLHMAGTTTPQHTRAGEYTLELDRELVDE